MKNELKVVLLAFAFLMVLIVSVNVLGFTENDVTDYYSNSGQSVPGNVLNNTSIEWCLNSLPADFLDNGSLNSKALSQGVILASNNVSCTCWGGDIVSETDWRDLYCEKSMEGLLKQYSIQVKKIKPDCSLTEEVKQYKDKLFEECKVCPDPVSESEWVNVGCSKNNELIQKKSVIGFLWDAGLNDCHKVSLDLFEVSSNDSCSIPVLKNAVGLQSYWWVFLLLSLGFGFLIARHERWI